MPIEFSLETLPPADRLATWHEVIWKNYVPLDITTDVAAPARLVGTVSTSTLADIRIATSSSSAAHEIVRTRRLAAADDQSWVMVGRQQRGRGRVAQWGNEAELAPGDLVLWDTRTPYEIRFPGEWRMQVFQFRPERLGLGDETIRQIAGRRFAASDAFFRSVSAYLDVLTTMADEGIGEADDIAASTAGLVQAATERLRGHAPTPTDLPDGFRLRVLAFVDANLVDLGLCAGSVAHAFGVSVRQLHRAFSGAERTIGQEIRYRRLSAARNELADPRCRHRTIAAVARGWGYPDPAHFSREFKRLYGVTPAQWRTAAGGR